MNTENIIKAIAVMQRIIAVHGSFIMLHWQSERITISGKAEWSPLPSQSFSPDEDALHKCGNAACFAGYLSLSPEWREDMGERTPTRPRSLAEWFEIPVEATTLMIYDYTPSKWKTHILYQTPWLKVKPQDVIDVLRRLLADGPDFIISRYREYHTLP